VARGQGRGVSGREGLAVIRVLGRHLITEPQAVIALPEVVPADGTGQARAAGVGAVAVVQYHAAVQRGLIGHLQLHLHLAGLAPRAQHRGELAVRGAGEAGQLPLHVGEIGHPALGQFRHPGLDLAQAVVAGAGHAQAFHLALGHLQAHDTALDLLVGQIDEYGEKPALMVGLFQGGPGGLGIGDGLAFPQVRVDGGLDGVGGQCGVALHHEFEDVEARLLRPCVAPAATGQQQDQQAQDRNQRSLQLHDSEVTGADTVRRRRVREA